MEAFIKYVTKHFLWVKMHICYRYFNKIKTIDLKYGIERYLVR